MGRLWNKWLMPALFAVILFLCIRVANDIPKHEYYLGNILNHLKNTHLNIL